MGQTTVGRKAPKALAFAEECGAYLRECLDPGADHTFMPVFVERFVNFLSSIAGSRQTLRVLVLYFGEVKDAAELLGSRIQRDVGLGQNQYSLVVELREPANALREPLQLALSAMNTDITVLHALPEATPEGALISVAEAATAHAGAVFVIRRVTTPATAATRLATGFGLSIDHEAGMIIIQSGICSSVQPELDWHQAIDRITIEQLEIAILSSFLRKSRLLLEALENEGFQMRRMALAAETAVARMAALASRDEETRKAKKREELLRGRADAAQRVERARSVLDAEFNAWRSLRIDRAGDELDGAKILSEFALRNEDELRRILEDAIRKLVVQQLSSSHDASGGRVSPGDPSRTGRPVAIFDRMADRFERRTMVLDVGSHELWEIIRDHLRRFSDLVSKTGDRMSAKLPEQLSRIGIHRLNSRQVTVAEGMGVALKQMEAGFGGRVVGALRANVRKELVLPSAWEGFRWSKGVVGQVSILLFLASTLISYWLFPPSSASTGMTRTFFSLGIRIAVSLVLPVLLVVILYPRQARREQERAVSDFVCVNLDKVMEALRRARAEFLDEFSAKMTAHVERIGDAVKRTLSSELSEIDEKLKALGPTVGNRRERDSEVDVFMRHGASSEQARNDLRRLLEAATSECLMLSRSIRWS